MARMPLTKQQTNILQAAHYAAQKWIEHYVLEMCEKKYPENISRAQERKMVLDMLEEYGFGRFILQVVGDQDNFGTYDIEPYSYVTIRTNDDCRIYTKYSVSEVVAYLDFRGLLATQSAIGYIREKFNTLGSQSEPGQPFNRGWTHCLSKSGKRIIGNYCAGLDIRRLLIT